MKTVGTFHFNGHQGVITGYFLFLSRCKCSHPYLWKSTGHY